MAREARGGLGLGDRLVLLVAWIATCGVVYLLGFYVGEGTQARSLGEQQVMRLAVTSAPPPGGQHPKAEPEFAFYDKLMGEHGPERAPEPERVREEAKPAPPAEPGLPRQAAAATPPLAPVVAKPARHAPMALAAKPRPRPFHLTANVPEKLVAPKLPAPVHAAPPEPPRSARALPPPPAGGFTVLANPTRGRDEADHLVKQLRGRGYDANLVRVVRDGDTWYRVQVGRFTTSEQATEMMHRLREHEGIEHAFVASE